MTKTNRPGALQSARAGEAISGEMLPNITTKPNSQRHRAKIPPSRLLGYRVDGHLSVFPIWTEVRRYG
jgi:hypothetical protein